MAVTRQALIDIFCRQNPEFADNRPDPAVKTEEVKGVLSMPSSPDQMEEGYLYIGTKNQTDSRPDSESNVWAFCVSDHADPECENLLVTDKDAGDVLNAFNIAFQTLSAWEREVDIALAKGSSLQQILNLSEEIIELAVIVYDPSLKLLGYINERSKDNIFQREIAQKGYLAQDIFSSMSDRHMFEDLKKHGETLIRANEQPTGTYTTIKYITASQVPLAYVFVIYEELPQIEPFRGILDMLCTKIQFTLEKGTPFSQKQNYLYEYFLTDILSGNLKDPQDILIRFHYLDIPEGKHYVLLNLHFEKDMEIPLGYFSLIMDSVLQGGYFFHYRKKAYVLLHLQNDDGTEERETKLNVMDPLIREFECIAIASGCFEKLEQLPGICAQTDMVEQLFARGLVDLTSGSIIRCDDCRMQQMLWLCLQNAALDSWINPAVKKMLEDDARRNIKYIDFLNAYVEEKFNVSKTAERLCMHRSNVTYHLGRIKDRYGLDLEDRDQWMDISWNLMLIEFAEKINKSC